MAVYYHKARCHAEKLVHFWYFIFAIGKGWQLSFFCGTDITTKLVQDLTEQVVCKI